MSRSTSPSSPKQSQHQLHNHPSQPREQCQSYEDWLTSTYHQRYQVISFQTLVFTTTLFSLLIPLKFSTRYFQQFLPDTINAFLLPSFSLVQSTPFEMMLDALSIFFAILLLQVALHLIYLNVGLSQNAIATPSAYPGYQLLSLSGLLGLLGLCPTHKAQCRKQISTIKLLLVISLLLGTTFVLLCNFFELPTTTTPATSLFSHHRDSTLTTHSILSPFQFWRPSLPKFFLTNGDGYTIDCLAIDDSSPSSSTHSIISKFSTDISSHAYSLYNPLYYPSMNELEAQTSSHSNISDAIDHYSGDLSFAHYRLYVSDFRIGSFSERYDVNLDVASTYTPPNKASSTNPNLNTQSPRDRPLIPTLPPNSSTPPSFPSRVPTHAASRDLTEVTIQQAIPILSLHQYHRAIQTNLKPETIKQISSMTEPITTAFLQNPYPFFLVPLLFLSVMFTYYFFTIFGIPPSYQSMVSFLALIVIEFIALIVITSSLAFPVLNWVNNLITAIFGSRTPQFSALLHKLNSTNQSLTPHDIIAVTLPTLLLSQLSPFSTRGPLDHDVICPDSFALAFIPYQLTQTLSISHLIGFFIVLIIITLPFCYHVYRIRMLVNIPLNYSKYILQALTYSQKYQNLSPQELSQSPASFFSTYTTPHTLSFLNDVAKKDQLYTILNNSTHQPIDAVTKTQGSFQTTPYYTSFVMEYLIQHCLNSTTAHIYNLLFDLKRASSPGLTKCGLNTITPVVFQTQIASVLRALTLEPITTSLPPSFQTQTSSSPHSFTLTTPGSKSRGAFIPFSNLGKLLTSTLKTLLGSHTSSHSGTIFSLLKNILTLPSNIAVINGNVAPLVDQKSRFIYSKQQSNIYTGYVSETISGLLQLQQALEDLVYFIYQHRFPQEGNTSDGPSNDPLLDPQFLHSIGLGDTSINSNTKPLLFMAMVFKSPISYGQSTVLKSIYQQVTSTIQFLVDVNFPRHKINLNIAIPQSLTIQFNYYLDQRPRAD